MLIEQILKEAEAIRDIFQLFNQYPEYQRLFTQQYQVVRTQDPTADEPTVVGLAQERTGMILRTRGIDLDTKSMRGTDIVTQLNKDPKWSDLKNNLKNITKDAQAQADKNLQNIRGPQGQTNTDGYRLGADGRVLRDPRYYRDRTIGDVIGDVDSVKALQNVGDAIQGGSAIGAMKGGAELQKALGKDLASVTSGSSIWKGIKDSPANRQNYRPQYQK